MIIYLVRNKLNGKLYVGQTTRTARQRWTGHCAEARRGSSAHLHKAIRKHGRDDFEVGEVGEVLESLAGEWY